VIKRRGEAVGALRPSSKPGKLTPGAKKRITVQMEKVWAQMPQVPDSSRIIEEDRSR
jgi:hypothetical protein